MRRLVLLSLALTIVAALPAEARTHRHAHYQDKRTVQTTQKAKLTRGDKADADTDDVMDKRIKSICRGC